MRYYIDVTEEELEKAKKWKELAGSYNLDIKEMRELCYHIDQIRKILDIKKN